MGASTHGNSPAAKGPEERITETIQIRPMMQIGFTCNKCKTRVHKQFTKHAYKKGLVIITCPGCQVGCITNSCRVQTWLGHWSTCAFTKRAGELLSTRRLSQAHHLIADNIGWFKHFKGRNIEVRT